MPMCRGYNLNDDYLDDLMYCFCFVQNKCGRI